MPGPGRRFKPGQSGNPGGRPRGLSEVIGLARRHTADAIRVLCEVASQTGAHPSARVAAAVALLERGWGKPAQPVEADVRMQQSWVVRAPAPVADVDDWFKKYAPPEVLEHDGD